MSTLFEERALRELADSMREIPEFKGPLFERIRQLRETHKREIEELKGRNCGSCWHWTRQGRITGICIGIPERPYTAENFSCANFTKRREPDPEPAA